MFHSVILTTKFKTTSMIAMVCTLLLTACTTTDLDTARAVAQAGQSATQSVETNLAGLSEQATSHAQIFAFTTTLQDCEGLDVCTPWEDAAGLAELYGQYSSHVERREKAVKQLRLAYDAMLADAEADSRARTEESVGNVATSVTGYVTKLIPASDVLTGVLTKLAQQVAGLKAQNDQAIRLQTANDTIGIATALMAAALESELETHDDIDADIESYREEFREQLIRKGVMTQADILRDLAKSANIEIESDLASLIRTNSDLQAALVAANTTREKVKAAKMANLTKTEEKKPTKSAYAKAIASLSAMSKKHENFGELEASEWQRLRASIAEIQRLNGTLRSAVDAD